MDQHRAIPDPKLVEAHKKASAELEVMKQQLSQETGSSPDAMEDEIKQKQEFVDNLAIQLKYPPVRAGDIQTIFYIPNGNEK